MDADGLSLMALKRYVFFVPLDIDCQSHIDTLA
jgi:hypothetical protein